MLGGIGSGKSHVARRAGALGPGTVVDADELAREALEICARDGTLAAALGPGFVRDGEPDREALAERAFGDPDLLRKLEQLLHPRCLVAIRRALSEHEAGTGPALLVLDVALLLETGLDRHCDALWYVDVADDVRIERARRRGIDPEEIERRERFQTPVERKKARADRVIRNDVEADALDAQIVAALVALDVRAEGPQASTTDPDTAADGVSIESQANTE